MRDWKDMSLWGEGKEYPSPAEVKEQLTGRGGFEEESLFERSMGAGPTREEMRELSSKLVAEVEEGVTFIDFPHNQQIYTEERCPTCGRASECACGKDCPYCQLGVPRGA